MLLVYPTLLVIIWAYSEYSSRDPARGHAFYVIYVIGVNFFLEFLGYRPLLRAFAPEPFLFLLSSSSQPELYYLLGEPSYGMAIPSSVNYCAIVIRLLHRLPHEKNFDWPYRIITFARFLVSNDVGLVCRRVEYGYGREVTLHRLPVLASFFYFFQTKGNAWNEEKKEIVSVLSLWVNSFRYRSFSY